MLSPQAYNKMWHSPRIKFFFVASLSPSTWPLLDPWKLNSIEPITLTSASYFLPCSLQYCFSPTKGTSEDTFATVFHTIVSARWVSRDRHHTGLQITWSEGGLTQPATPRSGLHGYAPLLLALHYQQARNSREEVTEIGIRTNDHCRGARKPTQGVIGSTNSAIAHWE